MHVHPFASGVDFSPTNDVDHESGKCRRQIRGRYTPRAVVSSATGSVLAVPWNKMAKGTNRPRGGRDGRDPHSPVDTATRAQCLSVTVLFTLVGRLPLTALRNSVHSNQHQLIEDRHQRQVTGCLCLFKDKKAVYIQTCVKDVQSGNCIR